MSEKLYLQYNIITVFTAEHNILTYYNYYVNI